MSKYHERSNNEVTEDVEMPSYEEKRSSLYRTRHKFLEQTRTEFSELKDVTVPKILAESFLVAEDGDTEKILFFSTKVGLDAARNGQSKQFSGDGTFKRVPKPFYQIYTVHIDLSTNVEVTNVVPVLYALLPNKTEITYTRLFNLIRHQLSINIEIFKCDFEKAQINAVKSTFPGAIVTGCYFHFNQAVWKKAKAIGICEHPAGRHITRLCASIPLLPAQHIPTCWQTITEKMEKSEKMGQFQAYFEKQWVSMGPTISCGTDKRRRSNNALEGWNRRLNIRMPHKPTLIRFIYVLKKEAQYQDTRTRNAILTGARRRRNEIAFDRHFKKQLQELNDDKKTSFEFLESVATLRKRYN